MKRRCKLSILEVALLWGIFLPGSSALAGVVPIGPFPTSTLITFTGLAGLTEVNGLTVSGVSFAYAIGGGPCNGCLAIAEPFGTTNSVEPLYIATRPGRPDAATGTLTMVLPSPVSTFGYGYAVNVLVALTNATTISVFSGATFLGSLSYNAVADPSLVGGFAGVQSTLPFDRVSVNFPGNAAFGVDNIRIGIVNTPEPSTMLLVLSSVIGGWLCYRHGQDPMSSPSKTSPRRLSFGRQHPATRTPRVVHHVRQPAGPGESRHINGGARCCVRFIPVFHALRCS